LQSGAAGTVYQAWYIHDPQRVRQLSDNYRYGVPQADMWELVHDGFDRDDAVVAAEDFKYAPMWASKAW
jgi:hypothetical protein